MHIPTYAGLLRVSVSLILCTATRFSLKILLLTKVSLKANFSSFSLLVASLACTHFRIFSIVLPNTELFVSLKKSFLNGFFAFAIFWVLKSIYCFKQGD